MESSELESALRALGAVLQDRELHYEIVAIGGGSLLLTGFVERPTEDLDIVALAEGDQLLSAKPLPDDLAAAIASVAGLLNLSSNWLNSGPSSLLELGLPDGFRERTTTRRYDSLVVHHAGRLDQICFKLYAAVDQGPRSKHMHDLRQLEPGVDELRSAARWTRTHDTSNAFREQLVQALESMGVRDVDA